MNNIRVAVGQIYQETNCFSPRLTGLPDFRSRYLLKGAQLIDELRGTQTEIGGFIQVLEHANVTMIPTVAAWAMPGGKVEGRIVTASLIIDEGAYFTGIVDPSLAETVIAVSRHRLRQDSEETS